MVMNNPGIYPAFYVKAHNDLQKKAEQNLMYAQGYIPSEKRTLGDIASDSVVLGGGVGAVFSGGAWAIGNRKDLKGAWNKLKNAPVNEVRNFDSFIRQANDAKARKLIIEGRKMEAGSGKMIRYAKRAISAENAQSATFLKKAQGEYKDLQKAARANAKPGIFARAKTFLANVTPGFIKDNYNAAKGFVGEKVGKPMGEFIAKHPTLAKTVDFCKGKGAVFTAAIEGLIEAFTEVAPAFEVGGFTGGIKQIFKSGVKVGAAVGGWIAGEAAGATVGAGIGAAVGSVVPIVGTAVGAAIGSVVGGLIGGFFGAEACKEIAGAVVGKSVREQFMEEKIKEQASEVISNRQMAMQLNMLVNQRLQEQLAYGEITQEEYYQKLHQMKI